MTHDVLRARVSNAEWWIKKGGPTCSVCGAALTPDVTVHRVNGKACCSEDCKSDLLAVPCVHCGKPAAWPYRYVGTVNGEVQRACSLECGRATFWKGSKLAVGYMVTSP